MPTPILYPAVPPTRTGTQVVYTRDTWDSPWIERPELHCVRAALSTRPGMPVAEFRYRFGTGIPMGASSWITQPPIAVNARGYVRAIFNPTPRIGVDPMSQENYVFTGVWRAATTRTQTQDFRALDLTHLFDRPLLDSPFIEPGSDGVQWARCGIEFMPGYGNRSQNRHTVNGRSVYVFTSDRETATLWRPRDAFELIVTLATPTDGEGQVVWMPDLSIGAIPNYGAMRMPTHGRTYLSLLDAIATRFRLLTWWLDSRTDPLVIRAETFAENPIELRDVNNDLIGTIPANTDQLALSFAADQSASSALTIEAAHVHDRVRVRSGQQKIICSLSHEDNTLEPGWTLQEEADYQTAARDAEDYPDDDEPALQDTRNRDARAVDRLQNVFCRFTPPAVGWDQLVGDGEGGDKHALATENGDQFFVHRDLLRMSSRTAMWGGFDYSGDALDNEPDANGHRGDLVGADDGYYGRVSTLVVFQVKPAELDEAVPPNVTEPAKWQLAERIGVCGDVEPIAEDDPEEPPTNRRWSASVNVSEELPELFVRVHGEQQHVIAREDMHGHPDEIPGSLDWREMIVTVQLSDSRHVEVVYPPDEEIETVGDWLQELLIETDGYQMVTVCPGTVVGVDRETQQLLRSDGGVLYDQRPQMELIAQRAYAWHSVPRYALNFSTGWIDGRLRLGSLVVAYQDIGGVAPVHSVVTEITLDYPVAQGPREPRPTVTYSTAFGELDPEQM